MLATTTTKGAALPPTSRRERDDNYHSVIYQKDAWRVIACKDVQQWVIQSRAPKTLRTDAWRGVSYNATRKSLIRAWHIKTGDYHGAVTLGQLPERIGGNHGS